MKQDENGGSTMALPVIRLLNSILKLPPTLHSIISKNNECFNTKELSRKNITAEYRTVEYM